MSSLHKTVNVSPRIGQPDDKALVLERIFDASPDMVFGLWSDPTQVRAWWHPTDFSTPVYEMDFRIGGAYRFCVRRDGRDGWAHGIYEDIDPPRRIVQTFCWDSGDAAQDMPTRITLTFEAFGDSATRMTFRQEAFDSDAQRHQHGQGWAAVIDSFATYLDIDNKQEIRR